MRAEIDPRAREVIALTVLRAVERNAITWHEDARLPKLRREIAEILEEPVEIVADERPGLWRRLRWALTP